MSDYNIYKPKLMLTWQPKERIGSIQHGNDGRTEVLVRAPNWLGDTMITMPAVYQLRQILRPEQALTVVCPESLANIWKAAKWVDRIIPLDTRRIAGTTLQNIRAAGPGMGIVLPNSFGSALDLYRCGTPVRIGRAGLLRSCWLTHTAPKWRTEFRGETFHQLSRYLEIINLIGEIEITSDIPPLQATVSAERLDELMPPQHRNRNLILAPGAAYGPAKQWPVAYFHQVARWWNNTGGKVYIVGTAADHKLGKEILSDIYDGINLCGKTDLNELMGVLKHSRCCVANDSGVMHLAAALGVDGVALFGSTNPRATGPLGSGKWIVLCDGNGCGPCFSRICPGRGDTPYGCLKSLRPDMVCDAVVRLIEMESG